VSTAGLRLPAHGRHQRSALIVLKERTTSAPPATFAACVISGVMAMTQLFPSGLM
jgi:hypothetical protein